MLRLKNGVYFTLTALLNLDSTFQVLSNHMRLKSTVIDSTALYLDLCSAYMDVYVKLHGAEQLIFWPLYANYSEKKKSDFQVSGLNLDRRRVEQFPRVGEAEGEQMGYRVGESWESLVAPRPWEFPVTESEALLPPGGHAAGGRQPLALVPGPYPQDLRGHCCVGNIPESSEKNITPRNRAPLTQYSEDSRIWPWYHLVAMSLNK